MVEKSKVETGSLTALKPGCRTFQYNGEGVEEFERIRPSVSIHDNPPIGALREIMCWARPLLRYCGKNTIYRYRTHCGGWEGWIHQNWFFIQEHPDG
jgi:hypothetical protein